MSDQRIIEIIGKKFSESASPHELKELHEWINASEANKKQYERFEYLWFSGKKKLVVEEADEVFSKIISQTSLHNNSYKTKEETRIVLWNRLLRAAAVLIFISVASFILYATLSKFSLREEAFGSLEIIKKSNPRGQKSTITLPDGSKVVLNSESYIEYPNLFKEGRREVKLKGEAFFEVTKNPDMPFVVHSGLLKVEVLGTSFNVKVNPLDSISSVAVVTGKVAVSKSGNNGTDILIATLNPEEMVNLNQLSGEVKVSGFNSDEILGWRIGILIFDHEAPATIISKLEKWYDVDFIIQEEIKADNLYTGTFKNASLEKVLDGWSYTTDFTYRIDGKKVYIN